ncbi:MAG: phosphatidylglycerophosphatase A [Opitutaceae bacterium]|jgi:phosphatidylglycerophosphatase A
MNLRQPIWTRFLPTRTVLMLATLGPVGRRLPAPGTWGSVGGLLYFAVFFDPLYSEPYRGTVFSLILSAVGGYLAVALCGEAEFRLGRKDPGEVILDEFVAMPLCFLGWNALQLNELPELLRKSVVWILGLALFRLFDIWKPFGIKKLQDLPGGWGIVVDDYAAALATCLVMHAAKLVWQHH